MNGPRSPPQAGDTADAAANMALDDFSDGNTAQVPALPLVPSTPTQMDPTSPANIAQAVATLLTPMVTEAVDQAVLKGLEHLHKELRLQTLRIDQAEDRISTIEDDATATSAAVARLSLIQRELQDKVDDLENRSRWTNLSIIGLPESYPASSITAICSTIILEQLGLRTPCTVEGAHRVGQPAESRSKPRPVIVRYLNNADKQAILQNFHRQCNLSVDDHSLLLFADYSVEVMRRCKAFSEICSSLFNNHIKFTLAYPAILHIQPASGERVSFTSPSEAEHYLNTTQPSDMEQKDPSASGQSSLHRKSPLSSRSQQSPQKPPHKRVRVAPSGGRSTHR